MSKKTTEKEDPTYIGSECYEKASTTNNLME